jgi:hypothetical protein
MHQTTAIALAFLMVGQFVILSVGAFVLWLAGDFGGAPKFFGGRPPRHEAPEPTVAARKDDGAKVVSLARDRSIQPQAMEDRLSQIEDDIERPRDRAVG